jgi:hypothetical protein
MSAISLELGVAQYWEWAEFTDLRYTDDDY